MTRRAALLSRLRENRRGVAMIEFALTVPIFLLVLMGGFDYCWQMYAQQVLQGAVSKAGRDATLQGNAADQSALDEHVEAQVLNVFKNAKVTFTRKAYDRFDQVGVEERYTDMPDKDGVKNGQYDVGECFDDFNNNGKWDADRGRVGNGGADDVVMYTASMEFDRVLPVWKMLGQPQSTTLSSSTILRNQPYTAGSDSPAEKCL